MKIKITIKADDKKGAIKIMKSVSDAIKRSMPKEIKKGHEFYNAGFQSSGQHIIQAKR